jgi:hypothetical protein
MSLMIKKTPQLSVLPRAQNNWIYSTSTATLVNVEYG